MRKNLFYAKAKTKRLPYIDNIVSEIARLWPFSVAVHPGLCRTWSETQKTGSLITRLKSYIGSWRNKPKIIIFQHIKQKLG